MKKTFIYMLSLLMMGLASCDEDFNKDVAPPQSNEQEATADITFTAGFLVSPAPSINLNTIGSDSINLVAGTVMNPPEGAACNFTVQISKTEDFGNYLELPVFKGQLTRNSPVITDTDVTAAIAVTDLDAAVKELFGKAPNANEVYLRVYAHIKQGTSSVRSADAQVIGPALITPVALLIEPAYYLIGDMNGWSPDALIKFGHSGADVYDDPNFSVVVEVGADTYFKIAPQSAVDAQAAGGDFWSTVIGTAVDGDTSLEGSIVTENAQAIKIEKAGYVRISLNMEEYTYKIEPMEINPFLYVPGNHQGWAPATAPQLYTANMDLVYDGFVYLDGEYKFTSAPDWDNTNYGSAGEGKLSTDGGAGNLNAAAGFYYLKADLNTLTYQQTKTDWGIIGDATTGGWDSGTPMTYNRDNNTWTVETTLEGGKELKFRANDGWDINLGGSTNQLTFGGDNIKIESSGTYVITLKLTNALEGYSCTLSKK